MNQKSDPETLGIAGAISEIEKRNGRGEEHAEIETETLSDGSKVHNVWIRAQRVYCRNEIAAINLITDINEAIAKAS